jgi:hypothetical protein
MKPFLLTLISCPTERGDGSYVGAGMPMAAFIRLHRHANGGCSIKPWHVGNHMQLT